MPNYKKMNPQVKSDLLVALRSGEYQQTMGALERSPKEIEYRHSRLEQTRLTVGNCCLGVVCDLAIKAGLPVQRVEEAEGAYRPSLTKFVTPHGSGRTFPPPLVRNWAGFSQRTQEVLAEMNDGYKTFSEIADWIEEHL